jgi:hypothetical protein
MSPKLHKALINDYFLWYINCLESMVLALYNISPLRLSFASAVVLSAKCRNQKISSNQTNGLVLTSTEVCTIPFFDHFVFIVDFFTTVIIMRSAKEAFIYSSVVSNQFPSYILCMHA